MIELIHLSKYFSFFFKKKKNLFYPNKLKYLKKKTDFYHDKQMQIYIDFLLNFKIIIYKLFNVKIILF